MNTNKPRFGGNATTNASTTSGMGTSQQKQTVDEADVGSVPSKRGYGIGVNFGSVFTSNQGSQVTDSVFSTLQEIFGDKDPVNSRRRQWFRAPVGDTINVEVWTTTRSDKKELIFEMIGIGVRDSNFPDQGMSYIVLVLEGTSVDDKWRNDRRTITYTNGQFRDIDCAATASDYVFGRVSFGKTSLAVRKAIQTSYSKKADGSSIGAPNENMHVNIPRAMTDSRTNNMFAPFIEALAKKCAESAHSNLLQNAGVFNDMQDPDTFLSRSYNVIVTPTPPTMVPRDEIMGYPIPSHITVEVSIVEDRAKDRVVFDANFPQEEHQPPFKLHILTDWVNSGYGPDSVVRNGVRELPGKVHTPLLIISAFEMPKGFLNDPVAYMNMLFFSANALCDPETGIFMMAYKRAVANPTKGDPMNLEGLEVMVPNDPLVEKDPVTGRDIIYPHGKFFYESVATKLAGVPFQNQVNESPEISVIAQYYKNNIRTDNIQFGVDIRFGTLESCEHQLLMRIALGWLARKVPGIMTQENRDYINGVIEDADAAEEAFHSNLSDATGGEIEKYYTIADTPVLHDTIGVQVIDNGVYKRDINSPEIDLRMMANYLGLANLTESSTLSKLTPGDVSNWCKCAINSHPYSPEGDLNRVQCNEHVNYALGDSIIRDQRIYRIFFNPVIISSFLDYMRNSNLSMNIECRNADGTIENGLGSNRNLATHHVLNGGVAGTYGQRSRSGAGQGGVRYAYPNSTRQPQGTYYSPSR